MNKFKPLTGLRAKAKDYLKRKDRRHTLRHWELHENLDELLADWIYHTESLPSEHTVMEFMHWSYLQCKMPLNEVRI